MRKDWPIESPAEKNQGQQAAYPGTSLCRRSLNP